VDIEDQADKNRTEKSKMNNNTAPKLKPGQVSLLRCDINTGHVLKTNGELYMQTGDTFETFDSLEAVEHFINISLSDNPDIEFVIYNHNSDYILSWNKLEKKRAK